MLKKNEKPVTAPQPTSLWNLLYRGQTLVTGQPYPVCVGKKNQLLGAGTHLKVNFSIVPHTKAVKV